MNKESSVFENPDAHPLIMYLLCIKNLGPSWTTWITETIISEIKRVFGVEISLANLNKLMAAKTITVSDAFWEEWEVFNNIVLALDGKALSTTILVAPDTATLMNSIEIATIVRNEPFSEEIARFVAACLLQDDVHYAPPPLEFSQIYISQPMYKCKDCGKTASALPPFNGICEECSGMYKGPKAFNFKPKKDGGTNLEYYLTYDGSKVKERYAQLSKEEHPYINETPEDIQCAKLIIARDYAKLKLGEFHAQMKQFGLKI